MKLKRVGFIACIVVVIAIFANSFSTRFGLTPAQARPRVDLALVLAIDCSFSVDSDEFSLQMQGLSRALSSKEVIHSMLSGHHKKVAITVVEWAGSGMQQVVVPWQVISNEQTILSVAGKIRSAPRLVAGKTSISSIIDYSMNKLSQFPGLATRQVIDISADGVNNNGELPKEARERALALGVTINGLTIINEVEKLDTYFEKYIIGGFGHFVLVANDYQSYEKAMKQKLLREIKGNPVS